ncbi:hypothetical protein [Stenotrophomonas maltophilia]|uniref:hypothetical protein n=1 Tax=Stenotrophomonas maltophilia TaxID=40324 RepID=UPI000C260F53|nr:hypothetical protein [Stenotrophomonas maltophilia]PJL22634.1 hypothetical protein B9Y71_06500 [Stenotrophomonas maltophilia]PJL38716.1 hypothetical protein B9Y80_06195 [Stenotrophomonas maltophilia]
MKELIEIENAGYRHRVKYMCDSEDGFGVVTRQEYSYLKDGIVVWSQEFPAGVSFREMALVFMDSGLYVRADQKEKRRSG